jgi:hypothetical protein
MVRIIIKEDGDKMKQTGIFIIVLGIMVIGALGLYENLPFNSSTSGDLIKEGKVSQETIIEAESFLDNMENLADEIK